MNKLTRKHYRAAAQRMYSREGEVEIDDGARLSYAGPLNKTHKEAGTLGADLGAYVSAWVWVPEEEARKEKA